MFFICIRLSLIVIMVYRPTSNSSDDNNHPSRFILKFFVDREMILIENFTMPLINWSNVHLFQGDFESTTQAFVDAFVSAGLSQWATESTFFLIG